MVRIMQIRLLFMINHLLPCVQYDLPIDLTCNKLMKSIIARAIYVRNTILNFNSHFKYYFKFQLKFLNFNSNFKVPA